MEVTYSERWMRNIYKNIDILDGSGHRIGQIYKMKKKDDWCVTISAPHSVPRDLLYGVFQSDKVQVNGHPFTRYADADPYALAKKLMIDPHKPEVYCLALEFGSVDELVNGDLCGDDLKTLEEAKEAVEYIIRNDHLSSVPPSPEFYARVRDRIEDYHSNWSRHYIEART